MKRILSSPDFQIGAFLSFVLTMLVFTYIIVEFYVSKELLQQNRIYINNGVYKLCPAR